MMKKYALKYGKSTLDFELPADQVLCEIEGRHADGIKNLEGSYRQALDHPIDAPPLREILAPDQRVAIIVSDITRGWQRSDKTLPVLLGYLNEVGLSDDQVSIVIGVGAHRPNTESEFIELCSENVCHRVRVVNHDAWDSNMTYLGKTSRGTEVAVNPIVAEADRLTLTGGVVHHYMAGFGGGRKSILVIATAGGYPKDINLYQSQKAIDNASYAMKPGGVAVILAQCPNIQDPPDFYTWFEHKDLYSMEKAVRDNFFLSGWLAVKQFEYKEMGTIILVTEPENFETARKAHVEPVSNMTDDLDLAYRRCGADKPTITVMPQGANTFPIID